LLYQPLKAEIYQEPQVIPSGHSNFTTTWQQANQGN
jgi:hypothetical protein